jgi:hypothetical protein
MPANKTLNRALLLFVKLVLKYNVDFVVIMFCFAYCKKQFILEPEIKTNGH